jgi:prepilin-type N-terminal cleavage/methylation domain-containing protein
VRIPVHKLASPDGCHALAAPEVVEPPRSSRGAAKACHPAWHGVSREGFTLLEMLLATLISALLMGAIYVAFELQMRKAQTGREIIEESTLAHSILARMAADIKKCVGPIAPVQPPPLLVTAVSGGAPTNGASSATPSSGSTGSSSSNSSSAAAASSSTSPASGTPSGTSVTAPPPRDTIQFRLGVQGGPATLTLYLSQLPTELDTSRAEILSDLRLVSYWLATDGTRPLGLVRREFKQVTADQATGSPFAADSATEGVHMMAEEVQSLQFRYFDGTNWVDTWDGSATGPDGLTPIGPPQLIEITMEILGPESDNRSWGQPSLKVYRHVVPILTADGNLGKIGGGS